MSAEIISIGSELTSGQSLDTNSRWLSLRLAEHGIPVLYHTTVADDLAANEGVFRTALSRAELIVVTGGLGPTLDDLTRQVLANVAGVELDFDQAIWEHIQSLFTKRNRQCPERNRVQAEFPRGSVVIPNPNGTAPGIWFEIGNRVIICMPGVPAEMFAMFNDWVLPKIADRFGGGGVIVNKTFRCYGTGESHIEEMLGDLIRRGREPEVGITASEATISLRVTAHAKTQAEAAAAIAIDENFIRERLGDFVYGVDDELLQHAVAKLLSQTGKTIATAESCTGGLVGHLLTEIPGISKHYMGGVVSYSNAVKTQLLNVAPQLLAAKGAVSPEVAEAMALGCLNLFGSDLAIAVTGIAGPDGGTEEKPVGLVYLGLAHAEGVRIAKFNWPADRSSTKLRSAKTALNLVRLHLLGSR